MTYKDALGKDNVIILATTCQDQTPHAIYVVSEGIENSKLTIYDCMMDTTIKNLKQSPQVCIVAQTEKEYYRIKGTAHIISSGAKLEDAIASNTSSYKIKNIIEISIEEVFDLDKAKKIL